MHQYGPQVTNRGSFYVPSAGEGVFVIPIEAASDIGDSLVLSICGFSGHSLVVGYLHTDCCLRCSVLTSVFNCQRSTTITVTDAVQKPFLAAECMSVLVTNLAARVVRSPVWL